jgi:hypothetical protein
MAFVDCSGAELRLNRYVGTMALVAQRFAIQVHLFAAGFGAARLATSRYLRTLVTCLARY